MVLNLIKGARQSGKSTYVLDNLKGASIIITPNVGMLKIILDKYLKRIERDNGVRVRWGTSITVDNEYGEACKTEFTSSHSAHNSIKRLSERTWPRHKAVWIEEITMINYTRLERIMKFCSQCRLDVYATFTPEPISPKTADGQGWLNIANWYDGEVQWLDLPPSPKMLEESEHFAWELPEPRFRTDILGEFVLIDDIEPRIQQCKGIDFA